MSYFDLRIPGLKMTVVQADGNAVQPVPVDELRIAVAETYDVIVRPTDERADAHTGDVEKASLRFPQPRVRNLGQGGVVPIEHLRAQQHAAGLGVGEAEPEPDACGPLDLRLDRPRLAERRDQLGLEPSEPLVRELEDLLVQLRLRTEVVVHRGEADARRFADGSDRDAGDALISDAPHRAFQDAKFGLGCIGVAGAGHTELMYRLISSCKPISPPLA
mgnify:CR=1 FL=1